MARIGESKLSRFGDAWRNVRFMLVYSPRFVFLVPGALATLGGLAGLVVLAALNGLASRWTGVSAACAMVAIVGLGALQLGLFARTYAVIFLGDPDDARECGWRRFRLEHGLALAAATFVVGLAITAVSFFDTQSDPRLGILGLTLLAFAFQGCVRPVLPQHPWPE